MEKGIYVTSMDGWGELHGSSFVRFVFSHEPCHRLEGVRRKVRVALNISQAGFAPVASSVD
jgi:N-succinyldiaminopimelate aminotransferase